MAKKKTNKRAKTKSANKPETNYIVSSIDAVCSFFNTSSWTIRKWINSGMPTIGSGISTEYDLKEIVKWKIEQSEKTEQKIDHLERQRQIKNQILATDLLERQKKLLPKTETIQLWHMIIDEVKTVLTGIKLNKCCEKLYIEQLSDGLKQINQIDFESKINETF